MPNPKLIDDKSRGDGSIMKRIAYAWARKLAQRIGADYVVIIAASSANADGERAGRFVWWGRNRDSSRAAFEVAQMIGGMAGAKPESEPQSEED